MIVHVLMDDVVPDHLDFIGDIGIYDLHIAVIVLHSQTQHTQEHFVTCRCVNAHPITF